MLQFNNSKNHKLFINHSDEYGSKQSTLTMMQNLLDLSYIKYDDLLEKFMLTNSGVAYFNDNLKDVQYYMKINNVSLESFGSMKGYVDELYEKLQDNSVFADPNNTLNENKTFNGVKYETDYNKIVFTKKNADSLEPMDC